MKFLSFDLENLNYRNKDLDADLDALRCTLDLFLHKTCLLVELIYHLSKIISILYKLLYY